MSLAPIPGSKSVDKGGNLTAVWMGWFWQLQSYLGIKTASGVGSPNGVVSGSPGDLYVSTSGGAGTTLYVKESGVNTNTGWIAK